MEEKNKITQTANSNKKQKPVIVIVVLLLIILIITVGAAYAKYVTTAQGSATAQIANMICTMEVQSSSEDNNGNVIDPADATIVNPYCIITLKDYTGTEANPTAVTQTDVDYTITVTPVQENGVDTFTMPAYNWYQIASPNATTGTKVATSTALTSTTLANGNFTNGVAETKYFKIVFLNAGTADVTRYVDFQLNAFQSNNE